MDSKQYKNKIITNGEMIDNIFAFLERDDHLNDEELREELREEGVDPDKLVSKGKLLVEAKLKEARHEWKKIAREKIASFKENIGLISYNDQALPSSELADRIKSLLGRIYGETIPSHALAYFRNLNEMTDDELMSIYKDLQTLEQLKQKNNNKLLE